MEGAFVVSIRSDRRAALGACRGGSAIFAVLMLLVIGVIIVASVLVSADAAGTSTESERQRTQSRAMAWSGVQAVMAELAEQREGLLDGLDPELTEEWSLFTLDDGTRGVVRLLDLDPESASLVASENAKLDLNTATAEMLALVPGLDETIAARIVEARAAQPFGSVQELLGIEGITPDMVYGTTFDEDAGLFAAAAPAAAGFGGAAASGGGVGDYLTVFSFDPNVQVGVQGEREHRGKLRVNLDQGWSDALEDAIIERFDANVAQLVKQLIDGGQTFKTDSELASVLLDRGVDAEGWSTVFDVFSTTDDEFLAGRVDVNRAGPDVLACVPGITPEKAAAIVDMRGMIDAESRILPTWLLQEGLIEPEAYAEAADWVTARSMQWRVRIEVGIMPGEGAGFGEGFGGFDESLPMTMDDLAASWDEPPELDRLLHRMVVEAVIDVASSRPRVAYLREVTLLEPVLAMLRAGAVEEDVQSGSEPPLDDLASGTSVGDDASLDAALDFGDEMDFGTPDAGEGGAAVSGAAGTRGEASAGESAAGTSRGAVDRRIGRWTTRKAGGS